MSSIFITKGEPRMNKAVILLSLSTVLGLLGSAETFWTESYVKAMEGYWGRLESVSGPGSTLEQTVAIRKALSNIIKEYHITSILDVPCGDFNWMKAVDLGVCHYIGGEIIKPLVDENIKKYGASNRVFLHIDVTRDALPQADLIVCRDLFFHLSLQDIKAAIVNFKRSGAKYLLTTTFSRYRDETNTDIQSGGFRTINLTRFPFNFPNPLLLINEHCSEQSGSYADKSLGLWQLDDITI